MRYLRSAGALALALFFISAPAAADIPASLQKGNPQIRSIGTLEFGPDGILFIGDSKSGAVFAIDVGDESPSAVDKVEVTDVEAKIGAAIGVNAADVLIHDMAVHPQSHNIYVSVSRGRAAWDTRWWMPNDIEDATILLRMTPTGDISDVSLKNVAFARADLPNPVDMNTEHMWKKGIKLRVDTITDIAYQDGTLYVAGLSNEEFASTMWQMPFPFNGEAKFSTLEIFHGAHGEYETHAPIRTFVPYRIGNEPQLLAAYLCTPLVTFPISTLVDGQHVKGKTVAEFGSGNYPLDMLVYQKNGKDFVVMANSQLPLLIFDPADIEGQSAITTKVDGYVAGVPYTARAVAGTLHLADLNDDAFVALQRMPSGKLDLRLVPKEWL